MSTLAIVNSAPFLIMRPKFRPVGATKTSKFWAMCVLCTGYSKQPFKNQPTGRCPRHCKKVKIQTLFCSLYSCSFKVLFFITLFGQNQNYFLAKENILRKRDNLLTEEGGRGWARSRIIYTASKHGQWSSTNYLILSAVLYTYILYLTLSLPVMGWGGGGGAIAAFKNPPPPPKLKN